MNIRRFASRSRTSHQRGPSDGGFTLVELLVVLVIMSLVMGLVAPRVLGYLSDSRVRAAKLQIDSLAAALDLFFLDTGRYPTVQEGLRALVEKPSVRNWNGPYLDLQQVPLDPWGQAYAYKTPGDGFAAFTIVSLGADGREGGDADEADIAGH